jgi:hypothetical protein
LRAIVFHDGREDSVIGGRALSGKSMAFTQELEIFTRKPGKLQIGAFVSDVGGNSIKVMTTALSVFERGMPSDVIRGWIPVRVKKTRQKKNPELRF